MGRRVRKIELPDDSSHEFELGDTAADIQQKREKREAREREEPQTPRNEEASRDEARTGGNTHKRRKLQKKGQGQRKVTQKQTLEERREHYSHDTGTGT